jgi:hypothetical protein
MTNSPSWVRELVDAVAEATTSINADGELGCHVYKNESIEPVEWEITIFGESAQMGGRLAAFATDPVFSIDVFSIATLFDTLISCRWQTSQIESDDDLGTHLSVEGIQNGEAVWLRIVSQKPEAITNDPSMSSRVRQR